MATQAVEEVLVSLLVRIGAPVGHLRHEVRVDRVAAVKQVSCLVHLVDVRQADGARRRPSNTLSGRDQRPGALCP